MLQATSSDLSSSLLDRDQPPRTPQPTCSVINEVGEGGRRMGGSRPGLVSVPDGFLPSALNAEAARKGSRQKMHRRQQESCHPMLREVCPPGSSPVGSSRQVSDGHPATSTLGNMLASAPTLAWIRKSKVQSKRRDEQARNMSHQFRVLTRLDEKAAGLPVTVALGQISTP